MTKPTNRRDFLRILTVAASAAATGGLAGCSGSSNTNPNLTVPPSPRELRPTIDPRYFPQSVASGDPRADSVILWTRMIDPASPASDLLVRVQVAIDDTFAAPLVDSTFPVLAMNNHCFKLRVTGLPSATRLSYRFVYRAADGTTYSSRIGRTRTAPAATADVPVSFALLSCQDYTGRYYNTLLPLLDANLDFIVHVGDYIYETTGDPSFQTVTPERSIRFADEAGALALGTGAGRFLAARSVDNYRQLYRTYRSDPIIQQLHERFPFVTTWDDHEFSDDSWRENGTFTDGRTVEADVQRKRNAEQAYFEYMPVDVETSTATAITSTAAQFPSTRLYREIRWGRNAQLILTDYRSFRPDHLIPEDAFPGTVVVDRAQLTQLLGAQGIPYEAVRANFMPYIDIDAAPFAALRPVLIGTLTQGYLAEGATSAADAQARATAAIRGRLAIVVVNGLLSSYNAAVPEAQRVPLISDAVAATADAGIAYATLGKQRLFSDLGARYFVVKDTYDLFAAARFVFGGSATQNAYGTDQDSFLRQRLAGSDARWKFVASSVSFTSMVLDLRPRELGVPAPLNQRFYLNVDQWDGFPNQRAEYLARVFGPNRGVVLLSGDIHASFATQHPGGIAEFTTPAVSSTSFRTILGAAANADPTLRAVAGPLIAQLDPLLRAGNADIRYAQTSRHGVTVIDVSADGVTGTFLELPEARAATSAYGNASSLATERVTTRLRWNGSALTTV